MVPGVEHVPATALVIEPRLFKWKEGPERSREFAQYRRDHFIPSYLFNHLTRVSECSQRAVPRPQPFPFFSILAHVSLSVTARLKTSFPAIVSLSTQK